MIKVFAFRLQTDKGYYMGLKIKSDFLEALNEAKAEVIKLGASPGSIKLEDSMRSVTLDEVLEAAKLDIKDFIKQAKISGAINESINDNS
jgi:hypothetical protein